MVIAEDAVSIRAPSAMALSRRRSFAPSVRGEGPTKRGSSVFGAVGQVVVHEAATVLAQAQSLARIVRGKDSS